MAKRYQHVLDSIRRDVASQVGGLLWAAPGAPDDDDDGPAAALVPA
jgi:integrase